MTAAAANMPVSFRIAILPWAPSLEDEARFRRVLHRVLIAVALLCLLMLFWPAPKVDRTQPQELPPRLARMLLDKELSPPPPPKPQAEAAREREQTAAAPARKTEAPKPEPSKEASVPEARRPLADRPPGEIEGARRKAAGVGLLAMKDQLAELRGAPAAVQLRQDIRQGPGVGTGVGVGVGAGTEPGVPVRSMITSNAAGGSGGINTAAYSRNTGAVASRAARPRSSKARRAVAAGAVRAAAAVAERAVVPAWAAATAHAAAARWPRAAAARLRARSKTSASCSSAARAPCTRSTTARCAKTRRCKARSSSS